MKHTLNITLFLIALFLSSHLIGLYVINHYLPKDQPLPLSIEKPEFPEQTSYLPIFFTLLIATVLALILLKFRAFRLWKLWFFFSVFVTLTVAFSAFIIEKLAIVLALIFTSLKLFKHNLYIHNFTEVFIYGGLAAIFIPVLNIYSVIVLLFLISIYDMIAVWKTKHMISLAKFQAESNIFAGLFVPYKRKEVINKNVKSNLRKVKTETSSAILGGGDIGFPLLFSGVVFKTLGLVPALIISLCAAISLFLLFIFAEKKKFYPAMPFITLGCLFGYFLVWLIF